MSVIDIDLKQWPGSITEIPDKPRPIIEGGWEATHWEGCPLAELYGVPGDSRHGKRVRRVYD